MTVNKNRTGVADTITILRPATSPAQVYDLATGEEPALVFDLRTRRDKALAVTLDAYIWLRPLAGDGETPGPAAVRFVATALRTWARWWTDGRAILLADDREYAERVVALVQEAMEGGDRCGLS